MGWSLNNVVGSISRIVWHCAAEFAALVAGPERSMFFRRREFRSYAVNTGRVFACGRGVRILQPGRVTIGERVALGDYTYLNNFARIEIGDDFLGAGHLVINTGTHDPVTMLPGAAPVKIGCRVWCGVNVTILGGVTIGDDVVIGAGSVVVRDLPSNSIAAGVPARVLRRLDRSGVERIWSWVAPQEKPRMRAASENADQKAS